MTDEENSEKEGIEEELEYMRREIDEREAHAEKARAEMRDYVETYRKVLNAHKITIPAI